MSSMAYYWNFMVCGLPGVSCLRSPLCGARKWVGKRDSKIEVVWQLKVMCELCYSKLCVNHPGVKYC